VTDTLILCYHAVSETWTAPLSVRAARFGDQLEFLKRRGYRGVTFSEAAVTRSRDKRVAITFDDGFHSVLDVAFPMIDRIGWPATVFVVTEFGDGNRPLCWAGIDHWLGSTDRHELDALDWEELRTLGAAGWEIASHTCSHPRLTQLAIEDAERELRESRLVCEQQLGTPCLSVAYPYGNCSPAIVEVARRVGYRAGAGLPSRLHLERTLEWPRVGVYHDDALPRFALKTSARIRHLRTRKEG
jgi:peptidoglycan/xylan/chitin deacetylase (PgdA/CDA1 family)